MKHLVWSSVFALAMLPSLLRADETNKWTCDVSLYGFAAGMSGDVAVKGIPADLNVGFDEVWENLEFTLMGKVRIGHGRWALTVDVIDLELGASKNGVSAEFEQWMVEPTVSYRLCRNFEALAGMRYSNLSGGISGPFGYSPSGTQDWWDPIVGGNFSQPLGRNFSFNLRGDIGGFGVGSELTWQLLPSLSWQFADWGSLQAGYRWVYADYETGSGPSQFKYDMLNQGVQVGLTFHF